jgi:hypothetical protein
MTNKTDLSNFCIDTNILTTWRKITTDFICQLYHNEYMRQRESAMIIKGTESRFDKLRLRYETWCGDLIMDVESNYWSRVDADIDTERDDITIDESDGMKLSQDELHRARTWYEALAGTDREYLEKQDQALAEKIYKAIGWRWPSSNELNIKGEPDSAPNFGFKIRNRSDTDDIILIEVDDTNPKDSAEWLRVEMPDNVRFDAKLQRFVVSATVC